MTSRITPIVETFYPSNAPHLASIASEIQTAVKQDLDQLLSDTARAARFVVSVAAGARALAAFARFRAALGAQIECSTTYGD